MNRQNDDMQALFADVGAYIKENYNPDEEFYQDRVFFQTSVENPDFDELEFDLDLTFSQLLFKLIKKHQVSEIDCYKNANLDRRLFSKIRSDDEYQPKKATVFALIIGLKLGLDEANKLLNSAGYVISHSFKEDLIIEYCITRKIYDITIVNDILEKFECSLLGSQ